jgi:cytochrome c oxidase subunit II
MRRVIPSCMVIAAIPLVLGPSPTRAEEVHEVRVVAKKFTFEPAVIQVTEGEPVRIVIHAADRLHGFAIRGLKIDEQVPRGGDITVEFTAPRAGRYPIACSEYCGSGHDHMKAALVSVPATTASR